MAAQPPRGPPWGREGGPALRVPASPRPVRGRPPISVLAERLRSLGVFGQRTRPPCFAVGKVSGLSVARPHGGISVFQAWTEYKLGGVQKSEFCTFRRTLATAQRDKSRFAVGRIVQVKHCLLGILAACGLLPANSHRSDACGSFCVPVEQVLSKRFLQSPVLARPALRRF